MRAYIFDLDGTLADTDALPHGRRTPWQLLAPGLDSEDLNRWKFSDEVCSLPGRLITTGYRVAVATRAPLAYASTLLYLLGVDTHQILPSCGSGLAKAPKIAALCRRWGLDPSEVAYVGDLDEDEEIAKAVGCRFIPASAVHSSRKSARPSISLPVLGKRADVLEAVGDCEPSTSLDEAALAFMELAVDPGTSRRRELQRNLFTNLVPAMQRCVLQDSGGLFQVRRSLVTQTELRTDGQLYQEYKRGLRRLFPPHRFQYDIDGALLMVNYVALYNQYGNQLRYAKDYGSHGAGFGSKFHSGPEVQLHRIDVIGDILAASLRTADRIPLVPVPSSPPSESRPGEVSRRLAALAASGSQRQWFDLLAKGSNGTFRYIGGTDAPNQVVLIDDQLTHGTSLIEACRVLRRHGHAVTAAHVFSVKDSEVSRFGPPPSHPECPLESLATTVGFECPCLR